jgi:hypothetical protein
LIDKKNSFKVKNLPPTVDAYHRRDPSSGPGFSGGRCGKKISKILNFMSFL